MLKEIGMLISSVPEYVKQRTEEIIHVHELETKLRIYTSEDFVTVIAPTLRSLAELNKNRSAKCMKIILMM